MKARKTVRKPAEAQKKNVDKKAVQAECGADESVQSEEKESANITLESQLKKIRQELAKETHFALESAVMFEHQIVVAAILLRGLKQISPHMNLSELPAWADRERPTERFKLGKAIPIVARNLREEMSDIRDLKNLLKRGAEARNRIVHDTGHILGNSILVMATVSSRPDVEWSPVIPDIARFIDDVKKMREEMSQFLELSSRVQKLTFEKLASVIQERMP